MRSNGRVLSYFVRMDEINYRLDDFESKKEYNLNLEILTSMDVTPCIYIYGGARGMVHSSGTHKPYKGGNIGNLCQLI